MARVCVRQIIPVAIIVARVCVIRWITMVRYASRTKPIILVASVVRFSTVMRLRGSYCYQDSQYQDYRYQLDCFDKDSSECYLLLAWY
jgi:hypothetical protein